MRIRCAIGIALFLVCAVRSQSQALSEPKFGVDIQKDETERQTFTLTNLSEKILTACTIQFSVSTQAERPSEMNWDSLIGTRGQHGEPQGPLEPGASVTMSLPHEVGGPFPDKVKVVAGIWADGETFGEQVWVKTLVNNRASFVSAYEQAIALLKEGIENSWTRQQYMAALDGKSQSLPFYSMRRTFQANQSMDQHPQHAKNIAQTLLHHFEQDLQLLRPRRTVEPTASTPGQYAKPQYSRDWKPVIAEVNAAAGSNDRIEKAKKTGLRVEIENESNGDQFVEYLDPITGTSVMTQHTIVDRFPPPPANLQPPLLLSPANGTVFDFYPRKTELRWQPVAGATSYAVQVDIQSISGPESPYWASEKGIGYKQETTTETVLQFEFAGAQSGRWRVWAVDAQGREGPKSAWCTFRYTK